MVHKQSYVTVML